MKQKTTFNTLLKNIPEPHDLALNAYASLFNLVERKLYAELKKGGKNQTELKYQFIRQFQITTRHFNAVWRSLQGKLLSKKELVKLHLAQGKEQIKSTQKTVDKLVNHVKQLTHKDADPKQADRVRFKLHQKKRRLSILLDKQTKNLAQQAVDIPSICFGSKRLFNAQHHLEKNNYSDHQAWKTDWQKSRETNFYVLGAKDESWGNQGAQLVPCEDGRFTLQLRLPDAIGGGWIKFEGITFNYGSDTIARACAVNQHRLIMRSKSNLALLAEQARQRDAKGSVSENALLSAFGQAVTVRFTRHKFGWQLGLTIDEHEPDGDSLGYDNGCLGVDVNADHLAVCVVTRDGNKRFVTDIACPLTGKMDADKRRAIIGDVVKELVDLAKQYEVGIAYEALDFMKKKSALRETGNFQYRSMLSCFAYNLVIESIKRRAFREGVQTRPVTAACTSIIGRLKYQTSKTTVHQAASWVIARRGLGMYKERIRLKVPRVIGEKAFNARQLTVSMAVAPLQRWIRANKVIGYFKKGSVRPEKLCNLKVHDGMLSIYT